jgi:nucleoside phosphorylase
MFIHMPLEPYGEHKCGSRLAMHTARVVTICAIESEAVHLRQRLADTREVPLARWRWTRGRLGGTTVDLVISGVGLINAAAATSALCAVEPPRALLNYGCAGAHREDIARGDVILATKIVHCEEHHFGKREKLALPADKPQLEGEACPGLRTVGAEIG